MTFQLSLCVYNIIFRSSTTSIRSRTLTTYFTAVKCCAERCHKTPERCTENRTTSPPYPTLRSNALKGDMAFRSGLSPEAPHARPAGHRRSARAEQPVRCRPCSVLARRGDIVGQCNVTSCEVMSRRTNCMRRKTFSCLLLERRSYAF